MGQAGEARILSVDVLRGATVAFMVVANNPGDIMHVYRELIHARWHGWTFVDFIFPLFLFLVGVSAALAAPGPLPGGMGRRRWLRAGRRAAILFALGLLVNAFPYFDLGALRIPGVLQRIAVVYLFALWLHARLGNAGLAVSAGAILVGYWFLWAFVPVPGLGRPSFDMEPNLQGWLDQFLLRGHIWEYDTTWDPEGLLSTVPCVALAAIGVLGGRWLKDPGGPRVTTVLALGLALHLAGLAWDHWFPINKLITTSSFVLFVSGVGVMLLAAAHALLDGRPPRAWLTPFLALGRNALLVFVASQLLTKVLYVTRLPGAFFQGKSLHAWLFDATFGVLCDHYLASALWPLAILAVLTLPALWMYRRGVVVRF